VRCVFRALPCKFGAFSPSFGVLSPLLPQYSDFLRSTVMPVAKSVST